MATVLERISASHSFTKMPAESAAPDEAIETSDSADTDSADTKDEDNLSRKLLELLSSHPLTPERLAYIREAAQDF
jgi:Zn-dependent protease with chaperone function